MVTFITVATLQAQLWQLRAHIFWGRSLQPSRQRDCTNAYVKVSFRDRCKSTLYAADCANPLFDEMLPFHDVRLLDSEATIRANPPRVLVEVFSASADGNGDDFFDRFDATPR